MKLMKLKQFVLAIISFFAVTIYGQDLLKETRLDSISVFFKSGSFDIKNPNLIIDRIDQVEKQKFGRIQLVGYTDSVGSIQSNQLLASNRIRSVKQLIEKTHAKGYIIDSLNLNESRSKKLVDDNQFRRVDILIYKIEPNYSLGKSVNLNIQFISATDYVEPKSAESLKKLLYILKLDDSLKIQLNGHVCCVPDQPMSLSRAKRVKSFLVNNGINEKRISCFGYSNSVKLVDEISPQTQAINRRVEVVFIKD